MSFYATADHEKEKLQYFASPEGRDDLYEYNQKERRSVLEVINYTVTGVANLFLSDKCFLNCT